MRFSWLAHAALLLPLGAQQTAPIPATIEQQGVPPIPVELMDDLSRYDNARPAAFEGWHPARREILVATRFGETTQLHRVTEPGGARRQVTFFTERVESGSFSQSGGSSVVALRDLAGTERYQIYRVDLGDGRAARLTDGKSRNLGLVWSNDGRSIAFTSNKRNGRDSDIYVMDPNEPSTTKIAYQAPSPGWMPLAWSPDNTRLLVSRSISINETQLHLVTIETGAIQDIAGVSEKVRFESAVFAANGRSLFVSTDKGAEFCRLATLDLGSKKIQPMRSDLEWDVSSLRLNSDGRYLAFVVNEDGSDRLFVIDTTTDRTIYRSQLPPGVIGGLEWRRNSNELGFSFSHARSPGDAYSVNVENGNLYRWTYSETGGVNPEGFPQAELIRWKSFDGRTISGFLYRPPGRTGAAPVVIDIHGGPEGQAKPGYLRRANYWLNELGVAIIFPNVRGSDGYGKTFLQLDNGFKREDSVKDIGALLDWIATQPYLDSKRVMVTGGSYGGYMTLASMVHYNDRIRCAVDVVGISNFVSFLKNTEDYRRDLRRAEYGDEREPKMRDFLETISPVNHAAKFTKPILIVQGKNDPRVPATESEQMVAAIRKQSGQAWYIVGLDEGHGFRKKRNVDYQNAAMTLFVKHFLLN